MLCPKCGRENPEDSLFCNKCGGSLDTNIENQTPLERFLNNNDNIIYSDTNEYQGQEYFVTRSNNDALKTNKKIPSFRNKLIKFCVIFSLIIGTSICTYFVNYYNAIHEAQTLYNQKNYIDAYNELVNQIILPSDYAIYETIKIAAYNEKESQQLMKEKEKAATESKLAVEEKKQSEIDSKRKNPFVFEDTNLKTSGDYTYYEGTIINNSDLSYAYVKLRVVYYDASNEVLTTDWTYVVGSEGIRPDEKVQFSVMTKVRGNVASARASWELD